MSDAGPGADTLADVQAVLGDAYTLERELGGGGMARVFVADERSLGRKVVVKLLAAELTAEINCERFEREIRLAASLQQANIVPLLAAGRAGSLSYYTMPLVEGRSLRERLDRDGPLPIRDAMSVLRDVARALAYAHERGVMHRDIKPGNVLLSGATAVVTDFGIAKALSAARVETGMETLTRTGVSIGTPAYMAPEQAAGDPLTDHRADVYAFGCLAYEVFTGKPPFHGRPLHQLVAAHFRETPQPLARGRPDAPRAVAALVARCLAKDPAKRPQSGAELLAELDEIGDPPPVPRRPSARGVALGVLITSIAVVALGTYVTRARGGVAQRGSPSIGTTNAAALAEYQLGQALVRQRGGGVKKGVERLEHAIALDPGFARAHAALATALELTPYFIGTPPREVKDRATSEARRALELDSTLAEAHSALGQVYASTDQWPEAVPEFERAIALEPDSLATRITYGRDLLLRGDVKKARVQFGEARRIAPLSPLVMAWMSYVLFLEGRADSALEESTRAIQLDSTLLPLTNVASLINLSLGRKDVARRLMAIVPPAGVMSYAPYVYAKLGDTTAAWRLIRAMESNDPRPWFTDVARSMVLLVAGDTARALDALERSNSASGSVWIFFVPLLDPTYDPLRRSTRFAALLRQAGLDVAALTARRSGAVR